MWAAEGATWAAEEFPYAVSGQLRIARERRGWTLAEAGTRFPHPMCASTLHRIETCQRPLRLGPLWEIATTYGLGVVKVITDAVASVGPSCPLPCLVCKGTGVASSTASALTRPVFSDAADHRQATGEHR